MAQAPSKRNYKQEYAEFHGKPEQVAKSNLRMRSVAKNRASSK
jgi:hypothetical protein